mmetsp:Transcript_19223/g.61564  ORF Transcript_19223/g.61564 Transcript_19223/m.61564 type:complete len:240 (-) Transcript_19223:1206-1925(-)
MLFSDTGARSRAIFLARRASITPWHTSSFLVSSPKKLAQDIPGKIASLAAVASLAAGASASVAATVVAVIAATVVAVAAATAAALASTLSSTRPASAVVKLSMGQSGAAPHAAAAEMCPADVGRPVLAAAAGTSLRLVSRLFPVLNSESGDKLDADVIGGSETAPGAPCAARRSLLGLWAVETSGAMISMKPRSARSFAASCSMRRACSASAAARVRRLRRSRAASAACVLALRWRRRT